MNIGSISSSAGSNLFNAIKKKGDNASDKIYVVKDGDTLYGIAKANGVKVDEIKAWNNLETDVVKAGQILIVSTKTRPFSERSFFALNSSLGRTELQAGFLPINNKKNELLISGIFAQKNNSETGDLSKTDNKTLAFTFEPQFQANLPKGIKLFIRTPITLDKPADGNSVKTSFLTDMTALYKGGDVIGRLQYGNSNLGSGQAKQYFSCTPYYRAHIYKDWLMLRVGTNYTHSYGDKTSNDLTIETKIEGKIQSKPWSGWGAQFFFPISLDKTLEPDEKRTDFVGTYLWMGSVLPKKWRCSDYFVEGGIWIGKGIETSNKLAQDLIAGVNIKVKFGTELRWWP